MADHISNDEVVLKGAEPSAPVDLPPPDPARPTPRRRGVFLPLFLGGALAAAAGAGSVIYLFPDGLRGAASTETALAALTARLDRQDETLSKSTAVDEITARIAAVEAEVTRLADAQGKSVASTDANFARMSEGLASLDARLTALEQNPVTGDAATAAAASAFRRELDALKAELASQRNLAAAAGGDIAKAAAAAANRITEAEQQAARLRAEAESAANASAARAAASRLGIAVEAGKPLQPVIDDLTSMGVTVPAAIADAAAGVPSAEALRLAFADAARSALAQSLRETAPATWSGRIAAFLRAETGARSLVPREGTDPDAVLSRAEAALVAGDLPRSLTELDALPAGGRAQMAEWITSVQKRLDLLAAIDALAAGLK